MGALCRVLDKGGLPLAIGADSTELLKRHAEGKGVAGGGDGVLVSDVNVLNRNLQVVDDLGYQALGEALILLLLFLAHAFLGPLLEQLGRIEFLHLDALLSALFLFFVVGSLFPG